MAFIFRRNTGWKLLYRWSSSLAHHGFPTVFSWCFHGFPTIFHDFPMVFPWFSMVFSMVSTISASRSPFRLKGHLLGWSQQLLPRVQVQLARLSEPNISENHLGDWAEIRTSISEILKHPDNESIIAWETCVLINIRDGLICRGGNAHGQVDRHRPDVFNLDDDKIGASHFVNG